MREYILIGTSIARPWVTQNPECNGEFVKSKFHIMERVIVQRPTSADALLRYRACATDRIHCEPNSAWSHSLPPFGGFSLVSMAK